MTDELETESGADEVRVIYDPIEDTPTSYVREPDGAHPPLETTRGTSRRHFAIPSSH